MRCSFGGEHQCTLRILSHGLVFYPNTIQNFAREVAALRTIDRIDHVILNAGILQYPNVGFMYHLGRFTSFVDQIASYGTVISSASIYENEECMLRHISSFDNFADHLRTNAVGPIITAQRLLHTGIPIGSIAFMSSDSGSATDFRGFEDGYAGAIVQDC